MEMAFVSWGLPTEQHKPADGWRIGGQEVRDVVEGLIKKVWQDFKGVALPERFPVMTYQKAMNKVSHGSQPLITLMRILCSSMDQISRIYGLVFL